LEVTTLNMLLRGDTRRPRDDLLDISLSLPFQTEVNTGFGVLAKVYLDALTHINKQQRVRDPNAEGVKEAKALALEICEETFPGVKSPKLEVERGFRFWDIVSGILFILIFIFLRFSFVLDFFVAYLCKGWILTKIGNDCLYQALTAMRQLHSESQVLRELIDQFEAAEAWLAPMRP
jgi:hypothetical protein